MKKPRPGIFVAGGLAWAAMSAAAGPGFDFGAKVEMPALLLAEVKPTGAKAPPLQGKFADPAGSAKPAWSHPVFRFDPDTEFTVKPPGGIDFKLIARTPPPGVNYKLWIFPQAFQSQDR